MYRAFVISPIDRASHGVAPERVLAYPLGTEWRGAPMAKVRMTDRFVASAQAGEAGRSDYFDAVTKGLVLRVSAGGRKTWTFFFTSPRDGKRARVGLGSYPSMSLSDARGRALEAARHVGDGNDQPARGPMSARAKRRKQSDA